MASKPPAEERELERRSANGRTIVETRKENGSEVACVRAECITHGILSEGVASLLALSSKQRG